MKKIVEKYKNVKELQVIFTGSGNPSDDHEISIRIIFNDGRELVIGKTSEE